MLPGWWFFTNPSQKYARQIGSFPHQNRDENKTYLKPPSSFLVNTSTALNLDIPAGPFASKPLTQDDQSQVQDDDDLHVSARGSQGFQPSIWDPGVLADQRSNYYSFGSYTKINGLPNHKS